MCDWTGAKAAFLTPSCTAALEMAIILADLAPGDEVIMPSFTFVTCATAFVLRGVTPVFVDVRAETFNIDETLIQDAITTKTKALLAVHYAGISCDMTLLRAIAQKYNLVLIEDVAHAILAYDNSGNPVGSVGDFSTFSFHETKNLSSGEGGALVINNAKFCRNARVVWEKGTNRHDFFSGLVTNYRWIGLGSSFGASEITAATLWAQIEQSEWITDKRKKIWNLYHQQLEDLERRKKIVRPHVPRGAVHNGHLYPILLPSEHLRDIVLARLNNNGIEAVIHYIPLHSSPAGLRYGRLSGSLDVTNDISSRLIRLPIWIGLSAYQEEMCSIIRSVIEHSVSDG